MRDPLSQRLKRSPCCAKSAIQQQEEEVLAFRIIEKNRTQGRVAVLRFIQNGDLCLDPVKPQLCNNPGVVDVLNLRKSRETWSRFLVDTIVTNAPDILVNVRESLRSEVLLDRAMDPYAHLLRFIRKASGAHAPSGATAFYRRWCVRQS